MAGDWLKVELCTPDKPELFGLAELLKLSRDEVLGKLVRLWCWFDQHVEDGNARSVTQKQIDEIAGCSGFANALVVVGWLDEHEDGIRIPNFERHLGKGAKKRALGKRRADDLRQRRSNAASVTREEKRREEIKEEKEVPLELPDWLPLDAWKAWVEVRPKVKAPNTRRALQLALADLARLRGYGQDPRAVLEQAATRGYRGLFPVKRDDAAPLAQPLQERPCAYCGKKQTGIVNNIPHCSAHSLDAMDQKPREQMN